MATRTQTVHTKTSTPIVDETKEHTLPLAKETADVLPTAVRWANAAMALDERLSLPLLKTPCLGRWEYPLSLPGSMFGVPMYSLLILPYVIAAVAEWFSGEEEGVAVSIASVVVAIATVYWTACIAESVSSNHANETTGLMRAFHPLGKKLGSVVAVFGPHTSILAMGYSSTIAQNAAAYYICVYFITQVAVEFFKTVSRRLRPLVKKRAELANVTRKIPQIQYFLSREHAMRSSFPSGDAAGSTTFAIIGLAVTPPEYRLLSLPVWAFFPLLSTFARVYFHAHFLGDVLAGHMISGTIALSALMHADVIGDFTQFTWGTFVLWQIPAVVAWYFCQKMKPKSAENIYNYENITCWIPGASKKKTA
mmetsp:Transcript_40428/g.56329  ORF Transcript_40428/g.56329 Transcript_40428/m.56329 type:complete len:365 (+) Transcript_40428:189-1283(+)